MPNNGPPPKEVLDRFSPEGYRHLTMTSPTDPRKIGEVFANDTWFRWPAPCRVCEGLPERRVVAKRRSGYESIKSRESRGVERRRQERRQSADGGPFALRMTWGLVDGQVECIGVEVWRDAQRNAADENGATWIAHRGSDGPAPVRSLREVALDKAIRHRRHVLLARSAETKKLHAALTDPEKLRVYGPHPAGFLAMIEEQAARFGERDRKGAPAGLPKRGRPRTADEVLWQVAHAYLEPPEGKTRTKAVQDLFDHADPRSAGKQIKNAEDAGFLSPPTGRGKARGPGSRYGERPKKPRQASAAQRPSDRTTKKGR